MSRFAQCWPAANSVTSSTAQPKRAARLGRYLFANSGSIDRGEAASALRNPSADGWSGRRVIPRARRSCLALPSAPPSRNWDSGKSAQFSSCRSAAAAATGTTTSRCDNSGRTGLLTDPVRCLCPARREQAGPAGHRCKSISNSLETAYALPRGMAISSAGSVLCLFISQGKKFVARLSHMLSVRCRTQFTLRVQQRHPKWRELSCVARIRALAARAYNQ